MKTEINTIYKKLNNYFEDLNRPYELKYKVKELINGEVYKVIFKIRLQNEENNVVISEFTYLIDFYIENKTDKYNALYIRTYYDKDFYINLEELSKLYYPTLLYTEDSVKERKTVKVKIKPIPHSGYMDIILNYKDITKSIFQNIPVKICIDVNKIFGKEKSFKTKTGLINYVYRAVVTIIDTMEYKDKNDVWGSFGESNIKGIKKLKKIFKENKQDFNEVYKLDVFSKNKRLSKKTLF